MSEAMKRIIIESPYAGDVEANVAYARRCMKDSLERGEAPFLSHLLYTQVLDDKVYDKRMTGIEAGLAWSSACDGVAVYLDRGVSPGMVLGVLHHWNSRRLPISYRRLDGECTLVIDGSFIMCGEGERFCSKACEGLFEIEKIIYEECVSYVNQPKFNKFRRGK